MESLLAFLREYPHRKKELHVCHAEVRGGINNKHGGGVEMPAFLTLWDVLWGGGGEMLGENDNEDDLVFFPLFMQRKISHINDYFEVAVPISTHTFV